MARTAIVETLLSPYQAGTNVTLTAGDAANDHQVDLTRAPKLVLVALNTNAATVDFTVELPAGKSSYNQTVSISHTIPAAVGGVPGVRAFVVDVPGNLAQAGNLLHIDSADANFADVRFAVMNWQDTPK